MASYVRILKRNKKQHLGRYNKELIIRLAHYKSVYHLVLARRRARSGCRYDKLGFLDLSKDSKKTYKVFGLNLNKLKQVMAMGATFHVSVYKLLVK